MPKLSETELHMGLYGLTPPEWEAYRAQAVAAWDGNAVKAAFSILSDVQEMISLIGPERESLREMARVHINRAKALMLGGE